MPWLLGLVALPLLASGLTMMVDARARAAIGFAVAGLALLCAIVLALQTFPHGAVLEPGGWAPPLGIAWRIDAVSLVLILCVATVALLLACFGLGKPSSLGDASAGIWFWPLFLFLTASLYALLIAGDLFNVYVTLELLTLSAVGLVILKPQAAALRAAMRYLLIGLAGSLSYLLGVGLIYASTGTLDIALSGQRLSPGPSSVAALALITAGLLAKTALFPLHAWLAPAHANAPTVASALLSALVIMGTMYTLLRLWAETLGPIAPMAFAQTLGIFGAGGVIWGSLQALSQRRLKLWVAYSTIAQFGYVLIVPALLVGSASAAAWAGGIWLMVSHAFAKASMFLAVGLILHARGRDHLADIVGAAHKLPMAVFAMGLASLTLMGLPPSGGFVAKWLLIRAALESGQWWWLPVLVFGGLLSAAYMFRVLNLAFHGPRGGDAAFRPVPHALQLLCLALALMSVLMGLYTTPILGPLMAVAP